MIRIFYGADRVKAQEAIRKVLGDDYEVVEGEELSLADVKDVFLGTSLFGKRRIVVKGLGENKEAFSELPDYLGTEHEVVIWDGKLDKRTSTYKTLKKAGVEMKEFSVPEVKSKAVFDILDIAYRDGARAVKMLEEIEGENEPYMFVGLLVSQAIKKYEWRYGEKEKRVLLELSRLDMQMKGDSAISSQWILVKGFLLRVSSL
ncbi:hypothetical protein IJ096_02865 [Candidatus Saccharibacteria bacterium]|nr:hypothetical protein [Candidatus Saccharibacteria bacterium]